MPRVLAQSHLCITYRYKQHSLFSTLHTFSLFFFFAEPLFFSRHRISSSLVGKSVQRPSTAPTLAPCGPGICSKILTSCGLLLSSTPNTEPPPPPGPPVFMQRRESPSSPRGFLLAPAPALITVASPHLQQMNGQARDCLLSGPPARGA